MNTLNYLDSKLYKGSTAKAVQLIRLHNPDLSFQGFAYTADSTPSHTEDNAYIAAETGTIFGISVTKGQIIKDTGSVFVAEDIEIYEGDRDTPFYINPKLFLASPLVTTYTDSGTVLTSHAIPASTRTTGEYYAGKYSRLYFLFRTEDANGLGGYDIRINYYDYENSAFGATSVVIGLGFTATDHDYLAMVITQTGYIVVVGAGNDDDYRIFKSDNPEDISSFTKITDATALGYSSYNNYPEIRRCKNSLIGAHRMNLYRRMTLVSTDEGDTWNYNKLYESDDTEHWAYGKLIPTTGEYGVFHILNLLNHHDGEVAGTSASNYPKTAMLWSEDGITWGNMEYYYSYKRKGFSKNISTEGHITYTELEANCMIISEPWGSSADGYPHNVITCSFVTMQGHPVVISIDGERDLSAGLLTISNYRVSRYNSETDAWVHTLIPHADINTGTVRFAWQSGLNDGDIDLILIASDGIYNQLYRYRLFNYGSNLVQLDKLTNYTLDLYSQSSTPVYWDLQGVVIFTVDTDGNVKLIRFDRMWR